MKTDIQIVIDGEVCTTIIRKMPFRGSLEPPYDEYAGTGHNVLIIDSEANPKARIAPIDYEVNWTYEEAKTALLYTRNHLTKYGYLPKTIKRTTIDDFKIITKPWETNNEL